MTQLNSASAVRALVEIESIDALTSAFSDIIGPLGMTASAGGMVSGPRALSPNPFHFATWPADWLEFYATNGFVSIDPIPRWAIVSGEAVSWSDVLRNLPSRDPGWKVQRAAQAHGYHEGFVTPVRTSKGALGLVSVGGGARRDFCLEERLFLQTVSTAVLMQAEAIDSEVRPQHSVLTLREQECIALLRQGFGDAEIGRVLGVAITTVRTHLKNARSKVGARNRMELAVR